MKYPSSTTDRPTIIARLRAKLAARKAKKSGLNIRRGLDRDNAFLLSLIDREIDLLVAEASALEREINNLIKDG